MYVTKRCLEYFELYLELQKIKNVKENHLIQRNEQKNIFKLLYTHAQIVLKAPSFRFQFHFGATVCVCLMQELCTWHLTHLANLKWADGVAFRLHIYGYLLLPPYTHNNVFTGNIIHLTASRAVYCIVYYTHTHMFVCVLCMQCIYKQKFMRIQASENSI